MQHQIHKCEELQKVFESKGSYFLHICHRSRSHKVAGCILKSIPPYSPDVTFGFQRNPDVAGNRGSGGWKRVQPIAIDYCTVAGTAGAECKGDRRLKGPDGRSLERTPTAFQRHKGKET